MIWFPTVPAFTDDDPPPALVPAVAPPPTNTARLWPAVTVMVAVTCAPLPPAPPEPPPPVAPLPPIATTSTDVTPAGTVQVAGPTVVKLTTVLAWAAVGAAAMRPAATKDPAPTTAHVRRVRAICTPGFLRWQGMTSRVPENIRRSLSLASPGAELHRQSSDLGKVRRSRRFAPPHPHGLHFVHA